MVQKAVKNIFRWSFYPGVLLLGIWCNYLLLDYFPVEYYPGIPVVITLPLIVVIVIFEQLLPYRKEWMIGRGDTITDVLQTFITLPIASKLAELSLPILLFYPAMWISKNLDLSFWPDEWSFIMQFILAALAAEFCMYWIHRLSHRIPFLWRFHSVHHGAERVYWINSGRFHIFDAFLDSMCYFFPVILFGAPEEIVVTLITLSAITGFLEHVNIDYRGGILNYVFNTAELHRWHHSKEQSESDNNYGKALIIWDLLFGTYYLPSDWDVEEVGLYGDDTVPNSYWGQMKYPFKG